MSFMNKKGQLISLPFIIGGITLLLFLLFIRIGELCIPNTDICFRIIPLFLVNFIIYIWFFILYITIIVLPAFLLFKLFQFLIPQIMRGINEAKRFFNRFENSFIRLVQRFRE